MSTYIYVVTLALDTPVYLTDMHRNYDYDGKTFIKGKLEIKAGVSQKVEPSASNFNMLLSAIDGTLIAAIAGSNYKGKGCLVERLKLNDDETLNSSEVWLDGDCNNFIFTDKLKTSNLNLKVSSVFGAFENTGASDIAATFADTINADEIRYWGKLAPVTIGDYSGSDDARDKPIGGVIP